MTQLIIMRDKIVRIMREYETWFLIAAKFIGMLFVFLYVNSALGYFDILNNTMTNVLLALICSIIPGSLSVFIVAAVIVVHMFNLSIVLALLTLVVIIILYLMFLRFAPNQTFVLLAVPVLMQWNLHYLIPVVAGVFFTPYAVVPAIAGVFMVKFLGYTTAAVSITGEGAAFDPEAIMNALNTIISQVTADKEIWIYAIVAAVTIAVIFIIRQFSFDYVWYVSIGVGAVVEVMAALICGSVLSAELSFPAVIGGALLGLIIAAILQFMDCAVDYSQKEYLQFEDDKYYYYVKAIPKLESDSFSQPVQSKSEPVQPLKALKEALAQKTAKQPKEANQNPQSVQPVESDQVTNKTIVFEKQAQEVKDIIQKQREQAQESKQEKETITSDTDSQEQTFSEDSQKEKNLQEASENENTEQVVKDSEETNETEN